MAKKTAGYNVERIPKSAACQWAGAAVDGSYKQDSGRVEDDM